MTSTFGSASTFWNQWVFRPKPAMQYTASPTTV